MLRKRWIGLLLAACLLPAMPAALAEDAVISRNVEAAVAEEELLLGGAALPGEGGVDFGADGGRAVSPAEDGAAEGDEAPEQNPFEITDGVLTRYVGEANDVVIPDNVRVIGERAFASKYLLSSVVFPEGITAIEDGAFASCYSLTEVALPRSLTSLGYRTFGGCYRLAKAVVYGGVTEIDSYAFDGCNDLTIYGDGASYADRFAEACDIPFVALTLGRPTEMGLNRSGLIDLNIKKKLTAKASFGERNVDTGVKWKTSNSRIARVSDKGVVTPVKAGVATITVTSRANNNLKARFKVRVVDPKAKVTGLKFVRTDRIRRSRLTLYVGESLALKDAVEISPYGAKTKLTWKSSDGSVASVTAAGRVTAQKLGAAVVTVTGKNGKSARLNVTVKRNRIDNFTARPTMSSISGTGQEIYLKSIEIVSPREVECEYYLVFKHLESFKTTHFSYIQTWINHHYGEPLVDGTVNDVKISVGGQSVTTFKVTYRGSAVKDTNINLKDSRDDLSYARDFWLEWKF